LSLSGKESPCLIATLDIFVDENAHIFLFQEFANRGHGMDFSKSGGLATEGQMLLWAQSIHGAMDYLGGLGISHRSIHPKHILLLDGPGGTLHAKLSGLRDAVIYWDPEKKDLIDQPCKSTMSFRQVFFHAPEVFGREDEVYDPIAGMYPIYH